MDEKGPVPAYSNLVALRLEFKQGGRMEFPRPSIFYTFIYQLDGQLKINDDITTKLDFTTF